jgi:hypothetical protein
MNLHKLLPGILAAFTIFAAARGAEARHDIREFGARGDGVTLCTTAIQKAVDACAADGGGTVYCGPGAWLTGTITLKSHVSLYLDSGCTLFGSTNLADYPPWHPKLRSYTDNYVEQSLIAGEDLEQVGICGRGTIDGNGQHFPFHGKLAELSRPYVIRLVNCTNVTVAGIALRSSPMWMQHYLACRQLVLRDLRVFNHVNHNNDGLDIDSCSDVIVSGCMIDSGDDALCFKSTTDRLCENVTVDNCILTSHCEAIKLGTESNAGFKNITINNCAIIAPRFTKSIYGNSQNSGVSGIAVMTVDGGQSENINISNITMCNVPVPIFIRLANRARPITGAGPKPGVGKLRHLTLSNISATGARNACSITGLPGIYVEEVVLSNIQLSFKGGEKRAPTVLVPDLAADYPVGQMFGRLPAYGIYGHHVRGLNLNNVHLTTEASDERPAILADDVAALTLNGVETGSRSDAVAPAIWLRNVSGAFVQGCQISPAKGVPLRLEGAGTQNIAIGVNDFSRRQIERGDEVTAGAVSHLEAERQ